MALQRDKSRNRHLDYIAAPGNTMATHYIFECGIKLNAQPSTIATATVLFHKFFKEVDKSNYDCYVIGSACLSLAGKLRDDPLSLRDILNVSRGALHRTAGPLELGEEYWSLRGSLAAAELLILRTLSFHPDPPNHHRYLLHYLRSLQAWFPAAEWKSVPIARTTMAFLQDFHHSPLILDFRPSHVAVACLCLALHCLGVSVPLANAQEDDSMWFSVFTKDLSKEKNWEIMEKIMSVYNKEQDSM
ncbi:cyclin Q isoform X2 [Arctopsyche grandis]